MKMGGFSSVEDFMEQYLYCLDETWFSFHGKNYFLTFGKDEAGRDVRIIRQAHVGGELSPEDEERLQAHSFYGKPGDDEWLLDNYVVDGFTLRQMLQNCKCLD